MKTLDPESTVRVSSGDVSVSNDSSSADGGKGFRSSPFIDFNTGTVIVQPMTLISTPGSRANQSFNMMLEIFECRVDVWQFGPAVAMLNLMDSAHDKSLIWRHAGYALLSVTLNYFEMVGKILNPDSSNRRGKDDFNFGFCDVYPRFVTSDGDADPVVDEFRNRLRNGLY